MEDGPPSFPRGSTCPAVLRIQLRSPLVFAYETVTRCGAPFQATSANSRIAHSAEAPLRLAVIPATPVRQRQHPITSYGFRLFPFRSPLLGKSRLISVPPATEMFHFAGLSAYGYVFTVCPEFLKLSSFLIRRSPGQSLLATTRSLSQPAASFIGSFRLGIHRAPLITSN